MFADPEFFDGVYGDEAAAEALDAFGEAFDGGVFDGFEDEKAACTDEMVAADPGLELFLGLKGIHDWPRRKELFKVLGSKILGAESLGSKNFGIEINVAIGGADRRITIG
jgi:hypothetical protein